MAEPKKLHLGTECPDPTIDEEDARIDVLKATILHYVPDFDLHVQEALSVANGHDPELILHHDAFGLTYVDDEYTLLGMAIKYAGLHGVGVRVIGSNGETFV